MVSINDRLRRLEASNPTTSKAERWRAAIERSQQMAAQAHQKLAALIKQKLEERGIDPNQLPPQTPDEHAESKRNLLQMLRAAIRN